MSTPVCIRARKRGPLVVEGPITLTDAQGRVVDLDGLTRVALCRCGHSGNKPLCDGAHNRVAFAPEDDQPTP